MPEPPPVSSTVDPGPGPDGAPRLAIEPIMSEVRLRARTRLGWAADQDGEAYEEVKAAFQAANEALNPGAPYYPQVLGREEDWEVPTPLVWESHRKTFGNVIIWFKKRLLFPLGRWLHSYTWHNLRRQQRLNLLLLSAVESLAVSQARLRRELDELKERSTTPPVPAPKGASVAPSAAAPPGSGTKMKLAFVVDRFGPDVPGGSERHCREFALRLAGRGHAVTVLTSCARDYVSWANHFEPGEGSDGPLRVVRFPVASMRDPARWEAQSRLVFSGLGSEEDERSWFRESGPYVPTLIDHLRLNREAHDLFIFFSYRYYPTFAGLPVVADRGILVPTAEEDPAIRLGVLREFFAQPLGIIHNTVEEHSLMRSVARGRFPPFAIIGSGVDGAGPPAAPAVLDRLGIRRPYLLCLGRVDPNKGTSTLLAWFQRYVDLEGGDVELVLAGASVLELPPQRNVRLLGHVSEEERAALLQNMHALVAPSPFESLSLALLEAWMHGRPALVNGRCKVLRGQTRRANGGLYYDNAGEFREALRYLLDHPDQAAELGAQGRAYAEREYAWPVVMDRLESFLQDRRAAVATD